ncbi:MAG: MFS transporter [Bifidobacteriaceae bacterium]|jgi:MFS family permease|nr:MFS transporter [Bifidobacteriaceae bacterium]
MATTISTGPPVEPAAAQPQPEPGAGLAVRYVIAYLTMYVALMTPVVSTLALKIETLAGPGGKVAALSIVTGVGAFFAFVANPLAGALSDRTRSRFGMRRPWLVGGVVGGAAGLTVLAFATEIWMAVVGWALAQASFNAAQAALQAILPDQIPNRMRAKVSGWLGIAQSVAPLIGVGLAFWFAAADWPIAWMIAVPAALGLAGVLTLALTMSDRLAEPGAAAFRLGAFLKGFWVSPRVHPDFAWAWLGRFLIFFGFASYNNYQVYFLKDRFSLSDAEALGWQLRLMVIQAVLLTLAASIGGVWSDRTGKRKIFVIVAAALAGLGLAGFAFAASPGALYGGAALWGLGLGAYLAVDIALVTDVLPNARTDAAKNLGVFNIANALPQSLAPATAPLFLAVGAGGAAADSNYTVLFLAAAVFALVGAATTMFIRGAK